MTGRKRAPLERLRRDMYKGQRLIGDYQSARRGTLGKRLARRWLTNTIARALRSRS